MSIGCAMEEAALCVELFHASMASRLSNTYSHIGNTLYKGNSTKRGNNPKAIKARRKKNKNKKTHRK